MENEPHFGTNFLKPEWYTEGEVACLAQSFEMWLLKRVAYVTRLRLLSKGSIDHVERCKLEYYERLKLLTPAM